MEPKKILVIAGPTGSGESAVTAEIIKRYPIFKRLVTATTRPPRLRERTGVDYYFFSAEEFQREISNGNILECQNNRNGVYYGSYRPDLEKKLAQGFNVIVNPDLVGARYYQKHYQATTVFIMPDSIANLKKRLLKRDPSISPLELQTRLEYAQREISQEAPFYDYRVLNRQNQLGNAVAEIIAILKKEGYRLTF
ncbi:hypothetical protein A3I35_02625 [Candidatus Falkowbacteria bacterium RIFCSPLOWO2_02_FULL_45_15]|uniref:Guanylate kinase-like domain-containing protein n=1 Tax=Candidatus Falkowbacteria bacterium RIFCSPLOWO2_02_FULL_45_15 TaxID=1797988 RepID=A0A1F5RZ24_9BACT|nr:MAG: hypothetical protein A3I35_02625 [Candidatus Falkowbacteria bacterium RIFCSPLOWO2_02_FULL_45_15]